MATTRWAWWGRNWRGLVGLLLLAGLAGGAAVTYPQWQPYGEQAMAYLRNEADSPADDDGESHAEHSQPAESLQLSPTAIKNIGLKTQTVVTSDFSKYVTVPAIVVERPGRSQIQISAPMTGIVTQVYPLERQSVEPGQPLFDVRLTHEDVVSKQSTFLLKLQSLDVINQELERLSGIGEDVIPGKRIIEQRYRREEAQTELVALRESLMLHGMTEAQVNEIESTRKLLQNITVVAPPYADNHEHGDVEHQYHVQSIQVSRGQSVQAGELLCRLADHCLLYVEVNAFEDDAENLLHVSNNERLIAVNPLTGDESAEMLKLEVQSVADQIDVESRALRIYLLLPNRLLGTESDQSPRFLNWKYRPGQRMEARLPAAETLHSKIVLPAEAVVIDGAKAFVFEQNGDHFDRVEVQLLYRDRDTVVLQPNPMLLGSTIATKGAFRIHLALKNQAGGAIDPHAGHNH